MAQTISVVDIKKAGAGKKTGADSNAAVIEHASNELVIAVVGHVGSGTSEVAKALKALLAETPLGSSPTDIEILKATDVIGAWAKATERQAPVIVKDERKKLTDVRIFQDLGDELRKHSGDHAAVAKGLAIRIRETRAARQSADSNVLDPIIPDGKPRAYILDSIRHPAEVELLRHIYQDAFVLIGVVCEETTRLNRVTDKYADAGRESALAFMKRDAKATEKHGQRVSDAFHLADFFVDNTADRYNSIFNSIKH